MQRVCRNNFYKPQLLRIHKETRRIMKWKGKKWLSLALAGMLAVSALAGCRKLLFQHRQRRHSFHLYRFR